MIEQFNLLKNKTICFLDCEYVTLGMAGKGRPNTIKDHIELVQIGCVCVNMLNGKEIKEALNIFIKPDKVTPENSDYDWFYTLTGLEYNFLVDCGISLKEGLEILLNYIRDFPVVIMKGDAEVIYNDSSRRLGKSIKLTDYTNIYILKTYLKNIFSVLNIEENEKNLDTCSGELHTLLEKPMETNNTHNALHDSKSMAYICVEYFKKLL